MDLPRLERRAVLQEAGPQARLPVQAPVTGFESIAADIDDAANVLRVQQARAARTSLAALETQLVDYETTALIGALERRGEHAIGLTDAALADFDKEATAIGKDIADDRVRLGFDAIREQRRASLRRSIASHESDQTLVYHGQVAEAQIESLANLAAADPTQAAYAIDRGSSTARDMAERSGAGKEAADLAALKVESGIHRRIIKGLLDNNKYAEATGYFERHRERMSADDAGALAPGLHAGREAAFASDVRATVRTLVSSAPIDAAGMVSLPALKDSALRQLQSTHGEVSEEQRLTVESYVEQAAADRERDIARGRESTIASAFQILQKNGGDMQALQASHPQLLAGMNLEGRTRVNNFAGDVATGATRDTDWQTYTSLIDDPQALKATNLDAIRDRLNDREYRQLQKAQQALIEEPEAEQNIVATSTLLKGMLQEAGYQHDAKRQGLFYSLLQDAVTQELAATGKKQLPQERIKELALDLMTKEITSRGRFFHTRETAFSIEVPDVEREKIAVALVAAGLPVTDYNILQAWRMKIRSRNQ